MPALKEAAPLRIDKNFDMPSIPLVLTKIIQILNDDNASAKEIEDLILHDPSLSVRILKLANSAFYSFRNEVKTVSHAIPLLGLSLVKALVIGVKIFDSFTKGLKGESALINQLWMHSFGVGLLAQQIWAPRTSRKEGEFAFLCGLLHDMGKVIYFKQDPRHYSPLFAADKRAEDSDISAFELEHYGVDHASMGCMLVKQWGLPPDLGTVIRKHHEALSTTKPLVAAVSVADMVAKAGSIGYDGDCKITSELDPLKAMLKMDPEEYEALRAFGAAKRKDVEDFFKLPS